MLCLEYACTDAEAREAQELNIRRQVGRGSKWRTYVLLGLGLLAALVGLYYKISQEVAPAWRPYVFAGLFVLAGGIMLWRRRSQPGAPTLTKVEISEAEITIVSPASRVAMPWSAFSQCLESPNLFVLLDRPKAMLVSFPKRAFPDENAQAWFREQANRQSVPVEPQQPQVIGAGGLKVQFQLGFRDYLDRTLASWLTWGLILGIVGSMVGISFYSAAHPPPNAIYSATQVFFMAMLPFLIVMAVVLVLINSVYHWRAHKQYLVPHELVLSEAGIAFASRDGSGMLAWTAFTRFKETRRSFILWDTRGALWMLIPRRAFPSHESLQSGAALIGSHLQRSRWFFK